MLSSCNIIYRFYLITLSLALVCSALQAQPGGVPNSPSAAASAGALPRCREQQQRGAITPALFHGAWRGVRAGKAITLKLGNNADMPGSLEGSYVWSKKPIALAGDNDGLALTLEESDDNTRVSGVWELKLCSGVLSGKWLDANYANEQAVELRRVR